MSDCRDIEALLVDHSLGELPTLKAAYVEAHLGHCPRCRAATQRLGAALSAAKAWEPKVAPEDLDRMVAQLGPYLSAAAPSRRPLGLALAAVLAALGLFSLYAGPRAMAPSAVPLAAAVPRPLPPAPAPTTAIETRPVERRVLRPGLRVVASADWDGSARLRPDGAVELSTSQGFAVIDWAPEQPLWLRVQDAVVEVKGTRFFVEANRAAATRIGVLAGQAQLRGATETRLGSGQAIELSRDGIKVAPIGGGSSGAHRADPFLNPPPPPTPPVPARTRPATEPKVPPPAVEPPVVAAPTPPVPGPQASILPALLEAEALAKGGDPEAALEAYASLIATGAGRAQVMARFERARLLSKLGRGEEAKVELRTLVDAPGEVGRQATILLCEQEDGCAARRCLSALAGRVPAAELEQKIARYACDD